MSRFLRISRALIVAMTLIDAVIELRTRAVHRISHGRRLWFSVLTAVAYQIPIIVWVCFVSLYNAQVQKAMSILPLQSPDRRSTVLNLTIVA
jgi:hypothetical protein